MNNLFPVNVRKINNRTYANDNYSLSTEQSILAKNTNVPATGVCTTTVATITFSNQGIPHGYIVGDVVTLIGTGVFNGAVTVTSANDSAFTYTVSTSAVTVPVNCTVSVTTLQVNEYVGTDAPNLYTVTQSLTTLQQAAPVGSCIPVTIVGGGTSDALVAPADSLAYSALVFTGKTVNMRQATGSTLTVSASRSTTVVTVVSANHGLQVGQYFTLATIASGGEAMLGTFVIATVADANTFTYTTVASGTVTAYAGTGYLEYTKIFLYKEGSRNILTIANEAYSVLKPFIASVDYTYVPTNVDATATLTAAQVVGGYITSTSASAVTMTMPTGTLLGAALKAKQGTVHSFFIDNTAGANTVTIAVGTNAVQSAWDIQLTNATASVTPAAITPLTIVNGTSGTAKYTIVFSSATAYTFSRVA